MTDREKQIIDQVSSILKESLEVSKIILFGSRAKRVNDERADFDFAVDCPVPDVSKKREVKEQIEKVAGLYKFDIVYLQAVDSEFKSIIISTGRVLYDRRD